TEDYFKIYVKGSPEKIRDLCNPETIPHTFEQELQKYTSKGFRVLGLGMKKMKMNYFQTQQINREIIESNLIFLGFLIVENKLKKETKSSIEVLKHADMKMIMATGDNILTAISVARDCNIIDHNLQIYEFEIFQNNLFTKIKWNPINHASLDDTFLTTQEYVFTTDVATSFASLPVHEESLRISNPSCGSLSEISNTHSKAMVNKQSLFFTTPDSLDSDTLEEFERIKNKDVAIALVGNAFESISKLKKKYIDTKDSKYLLYYEIYHFILNNGLVFARMSP